MNENNKNDTNIGNPNIYNINTIANNNDKKVKSEKSNSENQKKNASTYINAKNNKLLSPKSPTDILASTGSNLITNP